MRKIIRDMSKPDARADTRASGSHGDGAAPDGAAPELQDQSGLTTTPQG
ncbi:hypothetical protein A6302_03637 [Methylobrevis pamukkalensis]|uniref:Uncharacterized protein n=1 Tax=Methylobrevis pamukkalensis TaxID=1439726 RepID=A0A1E3GYC8_9HYPH|nr:hypothetical protein A6302_03637 [Methylobrevis pamukkalensis]